MRRATLCPETSLRSGLLLACLAVLVLVPAAFAQPTNDDSPFRASPLIWVYHSPPHGENGGDGSYHFTTVLPIGTYDGMQALDIWATGGAISSEGGPPLCISSAEPPAGNEICALNVQFELSGDGRLPSFTPAPRFVPLAESFVNPAGTRLRMNLTSAALPLPAGAGMGVPERIGSLALDVTGGTLSVSVTGVKGVGADGVTNPVASHILFIPEPSEILLLASGIGMLALLGRLRRVRAA